VKTGTIVMK